MSSHECHRRLKRVKTWCATCRERKARFKYRGEVRADRDHTLCFECYRAAVNRARARRMTETAMPLWMPSPFGQEGSGHDRILNASQLAHRQGMLDHLQRPSAVAS